MIFDFVPISLEQQDIYLQRLAQCPVVASDYSFANLWGWAEAYGLSWCWEKDLVWIRQSRPEAALWAPVGPWDKVHWPQIFADLPSGMRQFCRVPHPLARLWQRQMGSAVDLDSERDHWDYLYTLSDLVALKGKRFHKKKNLLNQFVKSYAFRYQPLDADILDLVHDLQSDWCTWRDCEASPMLAAENRAIEKTITAWRQLRGLMGAALLVKGRMAAYTVGQRLSPDTLVIHFEKGNPEFKGVYQAINQMFLAHAGGHFRYVNREQDAGDPGLRSAKTSYHPVAFLKKYRVSVSG